MSRYAAAVLRSIKAGQYGSLSPSRIIVVFDLVVDHKLGRRGANECVNLP